MSPSGPSGQKNTNKKGSKRNYIYIKKVLKSIFKKKPPQYFMAAQLIAVMLECLKKLMKLMVFNRRGIKIFQKFIDIIKNYYR